MAEETRILAVEKLATGGDGIAFLEGRAVFIPFAIPGEKVVCRIISQERGYCRAELVDILEPSPHRVEPQCPIYRQCGGCVLQHVAAERQRALKAEMARESFIWIGKTDPGPLEIKAGASYHYRNRVQLHFTEDDGIGFMEAASASPVRARGCPVAAGCVDAWLGRQNRKARPGKDLRAEIGERQRFAVFGQDDRLYLEGRDRDAMAIVAGEGYVFPLRHFFQSNLEMASVLALDVVEGLEGERAIDLYSGAGLFAKRLAKVFREVRCVEGDSVSLEAARANLPPGRGAFYASSVEDWIKAEDSRARKGKSRPADWVIADPPRAGLSPEVRKWLGSSGIGGLCYVSCDHATMARDIGELARSGWSVESLRLYDFYPQTARLEAYARMRPQKA